MLILPVSAISWLENDVFLIAHTPTSFNPAEAPPTSFTLVSRHNGSAYTFQRLPEVCGPFGLNRSPPHQFLQRLKNFPPSIQDIIIVASTAAEDVGLFSRSKDALTSDIPAERIVNVFTATSMANDSRRAQIPMTDDLTSNTSPIGMALDLSSKDNVHRPLPGEEMDQSSTPLPALMILNNEGVLVAWWIVYAESIRQGIPYSGLAALAGQPQSQLQGMQGSPFRDTTPQNSIAPIQNTFGASSSMNSFGNALSKPVGPAFGNTSMLGNSTSAFGAPSGLGTQSSPWGAPTTSPQNGGSTAGSSLTARPAFGSPAIFGSEAQGSSFGTLGGLGNKPSPWGAPPSEMTTSTGSVFGQSGGLGMRTSSPFGTTTPTSAFGTNTSTTPSIKGGGFASFAKSGGFASAISMQNNRGSAIGTTTPGTSFGSAMDTGSIFGGTTNKTEQQTSGVFEMKEEFTLGSTFKPDGTAKDDAPKPLTDSSSSFFDGGFGNALGDSQKDSTIPQTVETDMSSDASNNDDEATNHSSPIAEETTTPADTPAPSKFFSPATAPPITGGLFGTQAQSQATPAAVQSSTPVTATLEKPVPATTTPENKPVFIKSEPDEHETHENEPLSEAPLPPDPTSKTSYTPGGSSASSVAASKSSVDDLPLPPDFLPSKSQPKTSGNQVQPETSLPLDEDDEDLDDEGSGIDVAQEISPTSEPNQSPKLTPESSFGVKHDKSPVGGLFSKVDLPQSQLSSKPLFGEIGNTVAPFFPPPSKVHESPRSPSPVRTSIPGDVLRPDNARSMSAPGIATKSLPRKTATLGRYPQASVPTIPQVSIEERRQEERAQIAARKAKEQAEEEQELSDDEDEKVRRELETEVERTLTLEPFLAHQDYVGNINKPGIPGQVEKVYRDINSMIDTLGLNARSLEAFLKAHSELYKIGDRSREDLESDADWVLCEIEDLVVIQTYLEEQLKAGRLPDVQEKMDICHELQKDLAKLRSKRNDIKRAVDAKSDPDRITALRSASLNAEQASLQHDLRREFTSFHKLLSVAEQGIVVLKAKLTSLDAVNGNSNGSGASKVPTVEAVTNTILKMTNMVEKKSGDIDVLETQIRKLRDLSLSGNSRAGSSSREASPFLTPPTSTRKTRQPLLPRTPASVGSANGSSTFYTPRSGQSLFGFGESVGSNGITPTRPKRMDQVRPVEIQRYGVKTKRRKEINVLLKEALVKGGVRIRPLDEV